MERPSRLEVIVVHWGDNALRARAASVLLIQKSVRDTFHEILDLEIDRAIIFSWAKTMGRDNPSEARKMYDIFLRRLKVLDASKRIPWGVSFPKETDWLSRWSLKIGGEDIVVHIEEESVDTEDNAEKSAEIIRNMYDDSAYDELFVSPLSSGFHTKRIKESFERHLPEGLRSPVRPVSAENILKNVSKKYGGKYERYWELKEKSIRPRTKLLEVVLRIASKYEGGRKRIREITRKRVGR